MSGYSISLTMFRTKKSRSMCRPKTSVDVIGEKSVDISDDVLAKLWSILSGKKSVDISDDDVSVGISDGTLPIPAPQCANSSVDWFLV